MIHTTIVIPQILSHNFTNMVLHGKYLQNINYIQSTILCTTDIHLYILCYIMSVIRTGMLLQIYKIFH